MSEIDVRRVIRAHIDSIDTIRCMVKDLVAQLVHSNQRVSAPAWDFILEQLAAERQRLTKRLEE